MHKCILSRVSAENEDATNIPQKIQQTLANKVNSNISHFVFSFFFLLLTVRSKTVLMKCSSTDPCEAVGQYNMWPNYKKKHSNTNVIALVFHKAQPDCHLDL